MWEGPEADLTLTANAQPALMAVSLAASRALQAEFGIGPERALEAITRTLRAGRGCLVFSEPPSRAQVGFRGVGFWFPGGRPRTSWVGTHL
jgi:hypothetical protein